MEILATDDPRLVLERANDLLAREPVRNNVLLTLLHARAARPVPGRYWIVEPPNCSGLVFQSPTSFSALVSSMSAEAVDASVEAIAEAGVLLPGIVGEAATATRFAGAWTEATRSAATPVQGQRIYEVREVIKPGAVPGLFRPAAAGDERLIVQWTEAFMAELGEAGDATAVVADHLALGQLWLWDDGGPASVAALSTPRSGVVRVQNVYTPEHLRGRGYASSCVAALSARALGLGDRCILYTDLANATSNAIYRSIGYGAVTEILRYRFD